MIQIYKNLTASFDIDAEKCFTPLCPEELPVPNGHLIVDELNAMAQFARLRVGSKDAHNSKAAWVTTDPTEVATPILWRAPQDKNFDLYWPLHGVPGTYGFELLDGLPKPEDYDYFVWKGIEGNLHPYGACFHTLDNKLSTGAIEYLKVNCITTVLIGGLAADFCVGNTALQLLDAGFRVILNSAATKGISEEGVVAMFQRIIDNGGIIIDSLGELKLV